MRTSVHKPVTVALILLGTQLHTSAIEKLKRYKSKLFRIARVSAVHDLPNTDTLNWGYSKEALRSMAIADPDNDLTIGIIEAPLEGNYYTRSLAKNVYVTTLYQAADILQDAEIDVVNYLLKTIYANITRFHMKADDPSYTYASHHETRGCLYDMTGNKSDLVYACSDMRLCEECVANLRKRRLPESYIEQLKKELKPIRRSGIIDILHFIKNRPVLSLVIAGLSSVILNIVSGYLYDLLKMWIGGNP